MAVCLLEIASSDKERNEAADILEKVPTLRQKIAGKSIPLEVSLSIPHLSPSPTMTDLFILADRNSSPEKRANSTHRVKDSHFPHSK
jgi:hypothetical protein